MPEDQLTRSDETVMGPHGPIPVRVYLPREPIGVGIVWLHGGGFQIGDLEVPEADWVSTCFAEAGIVVVSVDYRLATDGIRFPIPSDDCLAAWKWAVKNPVLPVAAGRWHIGGGSAGGNLAASVALQARDGHAQLPRSSVLIYPILHSVLPEPSAELAPQLEELPEFLRYPPEFIRDININYVGSPELLSDPYAFPAHGSAAGLPPTLIINSDIDYLRPSGEAYGAQLALAGTDTTVVREVGVRHGHLNEPENEGAQRTVARMIDWLLGSDLVVETHISRPEDGGSA